MPSSPDYLTPLVSGLIGVLGTLLGASIAGFFQLRHSTKQRQYERASIAAAFATEINIQVQGVRLRRHEESVKALLVDLQAGSVGSDAIAAKVKPLLTRGADAGHPIFQEYQKEIGKLGRFAEPVARYHSRVLMIRGTILAFQRGEYKDYKTEELKHVIEEELKLWQEANDIASEIVPELFAIGREFEPKRSILSPARPRSRAPSAGRSR